MDIYNILSSKQNNDFYLKRYIKFLSYCIEINSKKTKEELGYCEIHHICPKSKELFPEYKSFSKYPWNKILLSARQHFIAHWMLYKCFGGSQTFAFKSLVNQKSKRQEGRYTKINSRVYENLRIETKKLISENNKGKSTYINKKGNKIWCSTKDPRVLSGELTSIVKGRIIKHSDETKNKMSISAKNAKHNPNKLKKLYFLDIRVEVLYHSPIFVLLLEQGWSSNRTKEYRVKQIRDLHCGKKRSKETIKKISDSLKGKSVGKKLSKEHKLKIRI